MDRRTRAFAASIVALLAACKDAPPPQPQVAGPVAIHLDFDHEVEVRALKLFMQGDVEVSGGAFGTMAFSGRGEWVRHPLPGPARGRHFAFTVAPAGDGAWIGEVE